MRRYFFTLMMTLLAVATAVAGTFTGRVVDETQAPVPFANVVLLNANDSAFVAGTQKRDPARAGKASAYPVGSGIYRVSDSR